MLSVEFDDSGFPGELEVVCVALVLLCTKKVFLKLKLIVVNMSKSNKGSSIVFLRGVLFCQRPSLPLGVPCSGGTKELIRLTSLLTLQSLPFLGLAFATFWILEWNKHRHRQKYATRQQQQPTAKLELLTCHLHS